MSSLLDRIDTARILASALVDAISVNNAASEQLSHIAVNVMIEGFDQRFTDSIAADGCATPRQFLKRIFARLPPKINGV